MPTWIPTLFIVLLVVSLISMFVTRRGTAFGGLGGVSEAAGWAGGTLTITSAVSGDADRDGARHCVITGMIVGPGASAIEVYQRMTLRAGTPEPFVGEDRPVVYKPGKVDSTWRFGVMPDSVN